MDFDEFVIELSETDLLQTVSDAEDGVTECSCYHLGPEHTFCSICSTKDPNLIYPKNERHFVSYNLNSRQTLSWSFQFRIEDIETEPLAVWTKR
jgi:hypothetical protein